MRRKLTMKDFVIKKTENSFVKYVVFGITAESPIFLLDEIKKELALSGGDKVLFDQLLQTGNTINRFLVLTYDMDDFNLSSANNINASYVGVAEKSVISDFLRENDEILKYSILLNEQKEIIASGGVL